MISNDNIRKVGKKLPFGRSFENVLRHTIYQLYYKNYLIKNNPTSSYLLRIKIPKDLRYYFDGKIGFTMSLKNGIYSQSIVFAKILHLEVESIFNSIRMGTMSKINVNQIKGD